MGGGVAVGGVVECVRQWYSESKKRNAKGRTRARGNVFAVVWSMTNHNSLVPCPHLFSVVFREGKFTHDIFLSTSISKQEVSISLRLESFQTWRYAPQCSALLLFFLFVFLFL